jgi:hypothetical protein
MCRSELQRFVTIQHPGPCQTDANIRRTRTNQDDHDIIRGALPEASHGLMQFLPALRNGEAIVVGEGVSMPMPMRIRLSPLPDNRRPRSATASFTTAWSRDDDGRPEDRRALASWDPRRGLTTACDPAEASGLTSRRDRNGDCEAVAGLQIGGDSSTGRDDHRWRGSVDFSHWGVPRITDQAPTRSHRKYRPP